jgi:hypothetical protein
MFQQAGYRPPSVAAGTGVLVALLTIGCAPKAADTEAASGVETRPAASTAAGFHFPEGDAVAGRNVFVSMSCFSCHEVPGETFPAPVAQPPVPVPLTVDVTRKTREQLAESILAPSHIVREGAEDVDMPELSRMGDYTEALTVAQLIDLVTYIKSLGTTV